LHCESCKSGWWLWMLFIFWKCWWSVSLMVNDEGSSSSLYIFSTPGFDPIPMACSRPIGFLWAIPVCTSSTHCSDTAVWAVFEPKCPTGSCTHEGLPGCSAGRTNYLSATGRTGGTPVMPAVPRFWCLSLLTAIPMGLLTAHSATGSLGGMEVRWMFSTCTANISQYLLGGSVKCGGEMRVRAMRTWGQPSGKSGSAWANPAKVINLCPPAK
jgi:hypothetical protein